MDLGFDEPLEKRDSPRTDLRFDEPLEKRDLPTADHGFNEPLEKQDSPRANLGFDKPLIWRSETYQGWTLGLVSLSRVDTRKL